MFIFGRTINFVVMKSPLTKNLRKQTPINKKGDTIYDR